MELPARPPGRRRRLADAEPVAARRRRRRCEREGGQDTRLRWWWRGTRKRVMARTAALAPPGHRLERVSSLPPVLLSRILRGEEQRVQGRAAWGVPRRPLEVRDLRG